MNLSILIPEATVNYITNPELRYDTTGWNVFGSTITRTLTQARFGVASLQVVTTGSVLREGAFFRVSSLSGVSEAITVSAYVRGSGRVRIRLDNNVVGGAEYVSQSVILRSDRWQRISMTGFSTGGNDLRLYVETDDTRIVARTFYVDGAQLELKPYATTYCDGTQAGCRWNGLQHGSSSQRDAATRAGGTWFQLAGQERDIEDLYMTVAGGLGVAPMTNRIDNFSIQPGGYFEGSEINPRVITLTFHAKHLVDEICQLLSLGYLHQLRQTLIDVLKPDLTEGSEDIWFMYQDGDTPIYFQGRYDGGLEGEWDVRNQFVNSFPLRLLCVSPLMREDDQEVQVLDFQDQAATLRVVGRVDGAWNNMNYGMNGSVGDLELGAKGEIVAAGVFGFVNFGTAAINPFLVSQFVSYWDGQKWLSLAASATGTTVNDVAIAPNGDIYIAGKFTVINGVAANNIAKWNGSVWSALGTGLNSDGLHISVAPNGDLYVGGKFTTAGGVAASKIARWNGVAWYALGQYSGLNSDVNSIAVAVDGTFLYVGGLFTDENGSPGNTLNRVCKYTLSTDRFTSVSSGFNNSVFEVILSRSGDLYACGDFTASGSTTINRIARFLGNAWIPLGTGMDSTVNSFDVGVNGDIIAVGSFSNAGGVAARGIALWNGSTWTNVDIEVNQGDTTLIQLAVQYNPNGDVYIAGFWSVNYQTLFSAINTITNPGSAESFPVVYVSGPGRLRWLENQTTKKRIFFDLSVLNGEEIFLDFENGNVISTVRGNILSAVLPGSDFHEFTLLPGDNKLAVFMVNDVGAQMQIAFTPRHWGVDVTSS